MFLFFRPSRLLYIYHMFIRLLYVFPFSISLCYHTIVLKEEDKTQRKKAKDMLKMLMEYYESFSHREGK